MTEMQVIEICIKKNVVSKIFIFVFLDFRQILKTIQHPLYKRAVAYYSDYYSVICGYEKDANIIKQAEIELQEIRELYEKEETAHAEHNPKKE